MTTSGLDRAMGMMRKSKSSASSMQKNIDNRVKKTAGGGISSTMGGAATGASLGAAMATTGIAGATAGPIGAGIGAIGGLAAYYFS